LLVTTDGWQNSNVIKVATNKLMTRRKDKYEMRTNVTIYIDEANSITKRNKNKII